MRATLLRCPQCKEPKQHLLDDDGYGLCLTCGCTAEHVHPVRKSAP